MYMLTGDWIVGFCDGEAHFLIAVIESKSRIGFTVYPRFRIGLAETDTTILNEIQQYFGFGRVTPGGRKGMIGARSPEMAYEVTKLSQCLALRSFFEQHKLLTVKRETFRLWSTVLGLMQEKRHLTIEGFLEILSLRDKMNPTGKKRARFSYRNRKYFEQRLKRIDYQLTSFNKVQDQKEYQTRLVE